MSFSLFSGEFSFCFWSPSLPWISTVLDGVFLCLGVGRKKIFFLSVCLFTRAGGLVEVFHFPGGGAQAQVFIFSYRLSWGFWHLCRVALLEEGTIPFTTHPVASVSRPPPRWVGRGGLWAPWPVRLWCCLPAARSRQQSRSVWTGPAASARWRRDGWWRGGQGEAGLCVHSSFLFPVGLVTMSSDHAGWEGLEAFSTSSTWGFFCSAGHGKVGLPHLQTPLCSAAGLWNAAVLCTASLHLALGPTSVCAGHWAWVTVFALLVIPVGGAPRCFDTFLSPGAKRALGCVRLPSLFFPPFWVPVCSGTPTFRGLHVPISQACSCDEQRTLWWMAAVHLVVSPRGGTWRSSPVLRWLMSHLGGILSGNLLFVLAHILMSN